MLTNPVAKLTYRNVARSVEGRFSLTEKRVSRALADRTSRSWLELALVANSLCRAQEKCTLRDIVVQIGNSG